MPRRTPSTLDPSSVQRLLRRQDGVVARRQLLELGGRRHDVRRLLARHELVALHPGVYVNHTGKPTRRQRQWAAVLACWPAALHRQSALEAHGMTSDRTCRAADEPVWVAVAANRHVVAPPGVRVERIKELDPYVSWQCRPPRTKVEVALLKVASSGPLIDAIAVLSDAVHQGLTTAPRLLAVLDGMVRLRGRHGLRPILADVAAGTRSVLEHRYLVDVERAHGLPAGTRQLREDTVTGVVRRDVRYSEQDLLVELDGAFGHTDAQDRWTDLDRDLVAAVAGDVTLRPGWLQVLQPCRLARIVALVLQARGWTGSPTPCGPGCSVVVGGSGPT